jgi:hypothetical protein
MSEPTTTEPAAKPTATTPETKPATEAKPKPAPAPDKPTPATTTQGEQKSDGDPTWLPERLERERRKMLRDMGVEDPADVKAALAELKKRRDAEKTELERLQTQVTELTAKVSDREALRTTVAARAVAEMAALPEAQQTAVRTVAGDDPQQQLTTIEAMRPTWAKPEATAPIPAPASTTAGQPAPAEASAAASTNHLATYEELQKTNPMQAATYRLMHAVAITKAQKARA